MRKRCNPHFKADQGIAHRTGRDDRLEYTAARSATTLTADPDGLEGATIRGWRWTRNAWNGLRRSATLHLCDVQDALDHPAVIRPGHTPDTNVHEHGLVRAVVSGRTVIAVTDNTT